MTEKFVCGRYEQEVRGGPWNFPEPTLRADGTCSHCGSLSEEKFFECADAGMKITPTDKSYKAYVDVPDPDEGKPFVISTTNFEREGYTLVTPENVDSLPLDDYGRQHYVNGRTWVQFAPRGATKFGKFYFQHLSEAGRDKFIEYANEKKFNLAEPGYFYARPYFTRPA